MTSIWIISLHALSVAADRPYAAGIPFQKEEIWRLLYNPPSSFLSLLSAVLITYFVLRKIPNLLGFKFEKFHWDWPWRKRVFFQLGIGIRYTGPFGRDLLFVITVIVGALLFYSIYFLTQFTIDNLVPGVHADN